MQVIIGFLIVLWITLSAFAWANDALANYEHNRYMIEAERTNQVQIHESGLTEREAMTSALVANTVHSMAAKPTPTTAPAQIVASHIGNPLIVEVPADTDVHSAVNSKAIELGGQAAQSLDGSQMFIVLGDTAHPVQIAESIPVVVLPTQ